MNTKGRGRGLSIRLPIQPNDALRRPCGGDVETRTPRHPGVPVTTPAAPVNPTAAEVPALRRPTHGGVGAGPRALQDSERGPLLVAIPARALTTNAFDKTTLARSENGNHQMQKGWNCAAEGHYSSAAKGLLSKGIADARQQAEEQIDVPTWPSTSTKRDVAATQGGAGAMWLGDMKAELLAVASPSLDRRQEALWIPQNYRVMYRELPGCARSGSSGDSAGTLDTGDDDDFNDFEEIDVLTYSYDHSSRRSSSSGMGTDSGSRRALSSSPSPSPPSSPRAPSPLRVVRLADLRVPFVTKDLSFIDNRPIGVDSALPSYLRRVRPTNGTGGGGKDREDKGEVHRNNDLQGTDHEDSD